MRDNVFLFVLFLFLKPSNDHRVMPKSNHKGACGVNMVIYVHCLFIEYHQKRPRLDGETVSTQQQERINKCDSKVFMLKAI